MNSMLHELTKRLSPPPHQFRLLLDGYPSNSRFAEAYRTLRTNIAFSFLERKLQCLLVSSAAQGEGKTHTVANLAFTMAETGQNVLMVDADLRKPMLSKLVPEHQSTGLTGLITHVFGTDVREGDLAAFSLQDLIRLLAFQKQTGYLFLQGRGQEFDLLFLRGELQDIVWRNRPEDRRLANLLLKSGLLTAETHQAALDRQKITRQRLGVVLVRMGMLSEEQLKNPLSLHLTETFRAALQLNTGTFAFQAIQESDLDKPSFNPLNYHQIYRKSVVGEENLPFLFSRIQAAIVPTRHPSLFLLPSGKIPPNPSELLGSSRLTYLINHLKSQFDVIIFDTPPILPASDALLLSPHSDGVILVTKAGQMNRKLVQSVAQKLISIQANLLGVVLNKVDLNREGYYRYYHKYYTSYYGDNA
jgi:capsular exopolysaccharide synthesis family protein